MSKPQITVHKLSILNNNMKEAKIFFSVPGHGFSGHPLFKLCKTISDVTSCLKVHKLGPSLSVPLHPLKLYFVYQPTKNLDGH